MGAGLLVIAALVIGAVIAYQRLSRRAQPQIKELTAEPFTALPGQEVSPAFSPDGSRIAFAWDGNPPAGAKGFDLYVKAIGSETLLRLTQHPSQWIDAAWSPDETQIAFHRIAGSDTGIYIVSSLGGPEQKLRSTQIPRHIGWEVDLSVLSWSSDGKWIAFSDLAPDKNHVEMNLFSTESSEFKRMERAEECGSDVVAAFAHRDSRLAYWCVRGSKEYALYSVQVPGGKPKLISMFHNLPPCGLTWSSDDRKLISCFRGGLSEIDAVDGSVQRLSLAQSVAYPAVSPQGGRLAFSTVAFRLKMMRRNLLRPESAPVELFPSTQNQSNAMYSPDGKQIAFFSGRNGGWGIWVGNDDGTNLVQVSDLRFPSGSPQWSPDGKRVAFDALHDKWEIDVVDVAERIPRKLVTNVSDIYRPHWSRDGKWIYFTSYEVGKKGIYRCPASGGEAVVLSSDANGIEPQESWDGSAVYFLGDPGQRTLKNVTLIDGRPGPEATVDEFPPPDLTWTVSEKGIYFVPAEAPTSMRFFDFSTRQVRPVFESGKKFYLGISVSPDRHWITYTEVTGDENDIMLVNDFR